MSDHDRADRALVERLRAPCCCLSDNPFGLDECYHRDIRAEAAAALTRRIAEGERLDKQLANLIELEAGYRESERLMRERLSLILTQGNAASWDEICHAAALVAEEPQR